MGVNALGLCAVGKMRMILKSEILVDNMNRYGAVEGEKQ